jgi:hypothetical protein
MQCLSPCMNLITCDEQHDSGYPKCHWHVTTALLKVGHALLGDVQKNKQETVKIQSFKKRSQSPAIERAKTIDFQRPLSGENDLFRSPHISMFIFAVRAALGSASMP